MLGQEINYFIVILIFGALLLLAFIQFINPTKVNKKGNIAFGFFLLLWATFWLEEVGEMIGYPSIVSNFEVPLRFLQFFTAVFFYIAIAFYSSPKFKLFPKGFIHLVTPTVYLILLLLNEYQYSEGINYSALLTFTILSQSLFYCFISYLRIRKHKRNILSFASSVSEIDLNWLENIIKLLLLLTVSISIYEAIFDTEHLNLLLNILSIYIVFFVGINILKQKEIFFTEESKREAINTVLEEEFTEKKLLSDKELQKLMQKVDHLMQNEEVYLENEINLIKMAKMISVTPHQLSYTINKGYQMNFFQFVNKFRIEKAKELLLDDKMDKFSILGIAYESGFNSKTTFYNMFKKETGQTPSSFKLENK